MWSHWPPPANRRAELSSAHVDPCFQISREESCQTTCFRVLSRRAYSRRRSSSCSGWRDRGRSGCCRFPAVFIIPFRQSRSPDATVAIEGTKLEAKSAPDGSYSIPNVPAGPHHLLVMAKGFVPARSELTVAPTAVTLDVAVDPELHYSEVVSVSPDARNAFDSYQPTTVLAGQDLAKQTRSDDRRDAGDSAGSGRAFVRSRTGATGHSRPRRRSRAHPRGRAARGRCIEPVGGPRRHREPGRLVEDRSRARSCDAPVRLERDRRSRQRDLRRDPKPSA